MLYLAQRRHYDRGNFRLAAGWKIERSGRFDRNRIGGRDIPPGI